MGALGLLLALAGCKPTSRPVDPGSSDAPTGGDLTVVSPRGSGVSQAEHAPPLVDGPTLEQEVLLEPIASVDVLVVGGGPAGLAAASDAIEAGAQVLLVEQKSALGGSLRYGVTTFMFSGTDVQTAAGVTDSSG